MKVMSNEEIRQMLWNAFHEGRVRGKWETTGYLQQYGLADKEPPTFDEWFEDNYGDIIGEGTESSVSEKEEVEILDGLGNVISRHDFEISPSDCESRRHS